MTQIEVVGSWKYRRMYMFVVTAFCMLAVGYCLWTPSDGKVEETAITMSFLTLISIVGSYVFGATWDDKNARSQLPTSGGSGSPGGYLSPKAVP